MDNYNILVSNAKSLIAEIESIKEEFKLVDSIITRFDERLQSKIDDLVLKSRLLFGEFDNGKPFLRRLKDMGPGEIPMKYIMKREEMLNDLKKMLSTFIEHIQEYRIKN